jgi:hypothetical protein
MATVHFSIPDDVQYRFDRAFEGQNRHEVIAALMLRAVEEEERKRRPAGLVDRLSLIRESSHPVTREEI